MYKFFVLLGLAAVASAAILPPGSVRSPSGRIVGGEDATIEKFPYQVSFRAYNRHKCGGSIIGKYWVLTAAHCPTSSQEVYNINAGVSFKSALGSNHTIAQIIKHENYGISMWGYPYDDIALIRVNEPFEFDATRQPIPLFNQDELSPPGAIGVVTGWGKTYSGEATALQTVGVPIIPTSSCRSKYVGLPVGQICAAYPGGGKDACQGDSGGPIAINGRLAGVVSWGYACGTPGKPGVYTEVAHYRDWIKRHSGI